MITVPAPTMSQGCVLREPQKPVTKSPRDTFSSLRHAQGLLSAFQIVIYETLITPSEGVLASSPDMGFKAQV